MASPGRKMIIDGEVEKPTEDVHYDFDLVVIGAGSGGVRASRFSAQYGAKSRKQSLLIECAINRMTSRLQWTCPVCSNVGLKDGGDGFYYCTLCNSQADDIIEMGVDDDDLLSSHDGGMYSARNRRHQSSQVTACEPITQVKLTQSQHLDLSENFGAINEDDPGDMAGPTGPSDFGSYPTTLNYEDYYSEIRLRYVMGLQIMIQLQCKVLVEKFNLNPLIIGLVGPIWLRFLASTRVMTDEWADEVIHESESQIQGEMDKILPIKYEKEPHNIHGKRAVTLWYISLSSRIPLYYSLAINFLVCHLAREAVLPTDIFKWTFEGKLPYFAAFVEIEKQLGPPSTACPINSARMFRPHSLISVQKLESLAAIIALDIGLDLPPVNFYDLASRFLNKLSIPLEKILPRAFHVYEWSMPPELYLSANKARLPTRAYVMSILIVTIRIIFNLNGFGKWEKSLSSSRSSSSLVDENEDGHSHFDEGYENISSSENEHHKKALDELDFKLDGVSLLTFLERKYSELRDTHDYSKDLFSYLQHCKQVVFADSEPSFMDYGEENIIEDLWNIYQDQKSVEAVQEGMQSLEFPKKIAKDDMKKKSILKENNGVNDSSEDHLKPSSKVEEAIKNLKLDMEENRFCYVPPRKRGKKLEYLSYSRKKKEGGYLFAVHADYYILLRACARVAQVDFRTLHCAVLNFERRLKQLEDRIDYCLNIKNPNFSCHKAQRDAKAKTDGDDDDYDGINFL